MAPLLMTVEFTLCGLLMFNLGLPRPNPQEQVVPPADEARARRPRQHHHQERHPRGVVPRPRGRRHVHERRHTPEDVQRYLYLEAERRAIMRKRRQLADSENDFFAPAAAPGAGSGLQRLPQLAGAP